MIRTFFPTLSVRQVEASISSMIWYNDLFTTSDRLIRSLVKAALYGQQSETGQVDGGKRSPLPFPYVQLPGVPAQRRPALTVFPSHIRAETGLEGDTGSKSKGGKQLST